MNPLRQAALALLCAAIVGSAPAAAKTRALVVGINDYPGITVNGVGGQRNLRGAVNDARNMQDALTKFFDVKPEEIKLLVDADASRENVLAQFREWLIESTESGDRAIFYFAGHGAQVVDTDGDEDDGFDEVLAPSDVNGELQGSAAGLTGFITDDEIEELLAQLAGRDVMMVVDACHSGTITRGALEARTSDAADDGYTGVRTLTPNGPIEASAALQDLGTRSAHRTGTRLIEVVAADAPTTEKKTPDLLAVWTAVASAQLAVEDLELGGGEGLFTNRFVKGIADGSADLNKNGTITASELLTFLRSESEKYCKEFNCGPGGLTPTLEAHVGYDGAAVVQTASATTEAPKAEGEKIASSDELPQQEGAEAAAGGGVNVALPSDGKMKLGEALLVTINSGAAGELIVLDVRDDGKTVQLFPNSPSLKVGVASVVAAGETRYLPGDLDPFELVPDAAGSGRIVALVIVGDAEVTEVTKKFLNLEPIPGAEEYVASLSRQINRAVTLPTGSEEALDRSATPAVILRAEAKYVIE